MLEQMNFLDLLSATSSQELEDGPTPSVLQDGRTTSQRGPGRLPANPSALLERALDGTTPGTYPPNLQAWSGPPAPQCCSASKSLARQSSERLQQKLNAAMQARLSGHGGMIYQTAWKAHTTPLGRQIFRLRASAPRTSGKEPFSGPTICDLPQAGWSTTSARDWKDTGGMSQTGTNPDGSPRNRMDQLGRQCHLAGWPSATATDSLRHPSLEFTTPNITLNHAAVLAGWPTCKAQNANSPGLHGNGGQDLQTVTTMLATPTRLTVSGKMQTGLDAGMESGGQLNPDHSRWLMGYPAEWGSCGAMAMQSVRGQRKSSSRPLKKQPDLTSQNPNSNKRQPSEAR